MTAEAATSTRLPPEYLRLWCSGLLWNLTRWMSIFVCSYLVNDLTGSPFLVQLVGSAFWAPMFFGGVLGGVISDRFDRRRTILTLLVVLIPVALVMAALIFSDNLKVWMLFPYMVAIGIGGVLDMTSRRALIFDLVGESRVTRALAYESLGGVGGNLTGTLLGGAFIAWLGFGPVFLLVAGCYVASFLLLSGLRFDQRRSHSQRSAADVVRDLREGFGYARRHQVLISILGITVIYNLFYFSFSPMIPVFAERLEVTAFLTGVLAAATSVGSVAGNLLIARRVPFGKGLVYTVGTLLSLVSLLFFAAAPWYLLALVALFWAGVGNACFATMQSVLVMTSADADMRGRAMGLLSMAIGVGPFAMLLLGGVAQVAGPQAAVMGNAMLGLCALAVWTRMRPEAPRLP